MLVQIGHTWILAYRIGNIRKAFNEFTENKIILALVTFSVLLTLIITVAGQSDSVAAKIGLSLFPNAVALVSVWLPLVGPIWGFLTDRSGYETRWKQGSQSS
ncbi:hypothetical protein HDU91_007224 [Kappamyces sp. JEL0680]|nr:hypothetical protein HDU91_007224 [Kappamyces sp. JEL0680]